MFKSLKEKLKGWITRTQEETEETVVETPREETYQKEETQQGSKKQGKKKEKETTTKEEKNKKEKKTPKETKKEAKKREKEPQEEQGKSEKETKEPHKEKTKAPSTDMIHKAPQEKQEEAHVTAKEEEKEPSQEAPKKEEDIKTAGFFGSFFKRTKSAEPKEDVDEPTKTTPNETKEEQTEVQKAAQTEDITPKAPIKNTKTQGFSLFKRKTLTEEKFDELFDELELILLQNNVAYEAIENIKTELKRTLLGEHANTDIETALKEAILTLLENPPNIIEQIHQKQEKPFVILFAGINGAGKTTTIAKLAHHLKKHEFSVCLASADTFRAAAIEQLQVHADTLGVPLIKKDYGADPASVGFDAIKHAQKNKIDVVLIDTAGRMNNRDSLMREIEKIARVTKPDLKIFLGESITGNDATEQARDFNDAIAIDGIILSKADVDEKGGTAISVSQVTQKPIFFLGVGQAYDDLEVFDKHKLIEKIFGEG